MTSSPLVKTSSPAAAIESVRQHRNPTIEDFNFPPGLPTADDLPCSDDRPVDSELQELIPGLLKAILLDIWKDRQDWLFGIDLGFYYSPEQPAIAPDGLLCLGVTPTASENLRSSYVLWQEQVIPLLALEIVSKTPGKERTKKKDIFESIGVLYYLVYAPLLKKKAKFQLYKLIEGEYVLHSDGSEPYWMPEIGLAIGAERQLYGTQEREWLFWYDDHAVRYPSPIERAEREKTSRMQAERQASIEKSGRMQAEKQADIEKTSRMQAEKQADIEKSARQKLEQENEALRKRLSELGLDS
jgi:Uma2 family endonuclease